MGRSCCVPRCVSNRRRNRDPNFRKNSTFKFPSDPTLKRQWLININRSHYIPTDNVGVCELHFDEKFINRPKIGRSSLIKGAVPFCLDKDSKKVTHEIKNKINKDKKSYRQNGQKSKLPSLNNSYTSKKLSNPLSTTNNTTNNIKDVKKQSINERKDTNIKKNNKNSHKTNNSNENCNNIPQTINKLNDETTSFSPFDTILTEINDSIAKESYFCKVGNLLQIFALTNSNPPFEVAWSVNIKSDFSYSICLNSIEKNLSINANKIKLSKFSDTLYQNISILPPSIKNIEVLKDLLDMINHWYKNIIGMP